MVESAAKYFQAGGVFMWILLGVLGVAAAICIERLFFYFFVCNVKGSRLVADVAHALNRDRIDEARNAVCCKKGPVNVLFQTALDGYNEGFGAAEIQEAVEETAINEIPRYSQRVNYLSLFANIATLLGLLGTIAGLMQSFSSLALVEASKKASLLAAGISQAMVTTAFGLIVAVPCMVMHTVLFNVQSRLTKDLDHAVVKLMNYLKKKRQ